MAHTPGPWKANRALFDKGAISWFIESESGETVARIFPGPHAEANAQLFVAAPDLLEVLEKLTNYTDGLWRLIGVPFRPALENRVAEARAAIAKAREA